MNWKRIIIYDDVQSFSQELKEMLQSVLPDAEIIAVSTADEALENLKNCDLLILDIELENNRNGIEFFKYLQKCVTPYLPVIFVSGYLHNVEKVFEVEADAYLMKPVTLSRLKLCLQRLSQKIKRDTILISMKNNIVSVPTESILFIENNMRHAKYFNTDGTELISVSRFNDLAGSLPEYFCHCHKSFYVNLYHVTSLRRYAFMLDNNKEVPVSQNYYQDTKKLYIRFIGKVL
ncbi:MAG: LytR/AlgR family response regulator transcription factor [Ruminococcus sp.]